MAQGGEVVSEHNAGYDIGPEYGGGRQAPDYHDTGGGGGQEGGGDVNATSATHTKGGTKVINNTTGRSPARCTDCICLCIFFVYMIFMFVLVGLSWSNGSDLQRLTRGADYKGSLCGVDAGVEDKRFLYFCRNLANESWGDPVGGGVDIERPSCVEVCPRAQPDDPFINCLQKQQTLQEFINVSGGPAGIVQWNKINVSESVVQTAPYDTIALRGKYCVPVDSELKEVVLHGPRMGGGARILNSLGSLRRPWLWLFVVVLVCCLVGYIYLFMLRMMAKGVTLCFMVITALLFFIFGLFFLFGFLGSPFLEQRLGLDWAAISEVYSNPLYSVNNRADAALYSIFMGLVLLCLGIFLGCKMCTLGRQFEDGIDLIETASECMHSIYWLMFQPLLLALLQFFVVLFLTYGFMELITQGYLEKDRVFIDTNRYEGLSADYKLDYWRIWWSVFFYLIGAGWIIEITISIGQFMIAFCIIAWYFMPKEENSKKRSPPMMKLLKEMFYSLFRHSGTICLGAFCISYARLWRFTIGYFYDFSKKQYIWEIKSVYDDEDFLCKQCHGCSAKCSGCLQWCGKECIYDSNKATSGAANGYIPRFCYCLSFCCREDPFIAWLIGTSDKSFLMPFKWEDMSHCTKDVYNDVIIRATDFFPANIRTKQIFKSVPACDNIKGSGQMITIIGVSFIPLIGTAFFALFMQLDCVRDESGSWYVSDPVMVGYFTLLLCMLVAYSFCMVFDHTADTLLYCYAWHKRNDKASIDKFIPDKLRYIVGWGDLNNDKYPYYGKAPNNMYLSTFVDWKAKGKAKASSGGGGKSLDPTTSVFFRPDDETQGLLS